MTLWLAVFGSILGSFLGTVVDRLPQDRSLWYPRSHCESCKSTLAWYDLIPIVSFLVLRGRCRECHRPIPLQGFAVECFCALLALGMGAWWTGNMATSESVPDLFALASQVMGAGFGAMWSYPIASHSQWAQNWILLFVTFGFVPVALIDARHYRIPNAVVSAFLVGWFGVVLFEVFTMSGLEGLATLVTGAMGGLFICSLTLTLRWAFRGGLGLGDVKLLGVLSLSLGGPLTFFLLTAASVLGLAWVIANRIATGTIPRKLPLGTLLASAWWLLFLSQAAIPVFA